MQTWQLSHIQTQNETQAIAPSKIRLKDEKEGEIAPNFNQLYIHCCMLSLVINHHSIH